MASGGCQVNAAIERALGDAAERYAARKVRVVTHLECTVELATEDAVLDTAVYTLLRAIPESIPEASLVEIWTRDRAGGDVELVLEVSGTRDMGELAPLAGGTEGDLLALALDGLSEICRARHGVVELTDGVPSRPGRVARRYLFLIPSLRRDPRWSPVGGPGAP